MSKERSGCKLVHCSPNEQQEINRHVDDFFQRQRDLPRAQPCQGFIRPDGTVKVAQYAR